MKSFTFYLYTVLQCAFVLFVLFAPIFVQYTEPTGNFKILLLLLLPPLLLLLLLLIIIIIEVGYTYIVSSNA